MRVVRTAFRCFLAMEISWRAGSATPLCRARDVDKTGDDFEVGHLSADFCLELRHHVLSAFAGEKACPDIPVSHPSTYVQTYLVGTYHPSPAFVSLFLPSLLRLLSSQLEDAIIPGTMVSISSPMSDMSLCMVLFLPDHTYSGSSIHPFPHLSSFVGWN